jgi:hypothetical protein
MRPIRNYFWDYGNKVDFHKVTPSMTIKGSRHDTTHCGASLSWLGGLRLS